MIELTDQELAITLVAAKLYLSGYISLNPSGGIAEEIVLSTIQKLEVECRNREKERQTNPDYIEFVISDGSIVKAERGSPAYNLHFAIIRISEIRF